MCYNGEFRKSVRPPKSIITPMKMLRLFTTIAVIMTACAMVSASEIAENFARWVPNFASSDQNQRRDAQQNWQRFCQQQGHIPENQKEIIRVSIEQLAKDNPVDTSVWIIRQLGIVGDATAVPVLARSLTSGEVRIRDEAARALANIPGKEAEDALKAVSTIAAAQLAKDAITSRTIKADIPRDDGVETALPMAIPFPSAATAREMTTLMDRYGGMSDMQKAQVLSNLTDRALRQQQSGADRATAARQNIFYIPFALEAVQSSDETLRNAGILAVGALGGEAEAAFLLEYIRTGANKDLARIALARMSGQRIDAILLESLKTETDGEKFAILADALNRRFNQEIAPILLERAKATGSQNRLQLLQLAEPTSSSANIADFVTVWAMISERGPKDDAERIIARLAGGSAAPVLQALGNNWDTPDGLGLLGRIGDGNSLNQIRQSRNAIYAFRNWTNAVVADDLMAFVKDTNNANDDRIAALRAFVRVISLPNNQIGIRINDVQKVNRLIEAYELATRADEKRLIIERVGQIRTLESLRFVLRFIDDSELRDRACESVLNLAHDTNFRNSARAEFNEALDKVIAASESITDQNRRNDLRNRANGYKAGQ